MSLIELLNKALNIKVEQAPSVESEIVPQDAIPLDFSASSQVESTNAYDLSNDDKKVLDEINNVEVNEIDYEQYVIDELEAELIETKEEFQVQDDKDGVINEIYNGVKEIFNFGISKSDVASAIEKQEDIVDKLKEAKINGNFAEIYEEITGQKYDEEKLIECHNTEVILNSMQSNLDSILNSNDSDEIKQQKVNEYLLNFQNQTGISYEQLSSHYKEMSNSYLAGANELTNVLNSYADSQDDFIDKTAQNAQMLGMAGMVIGGVACFIPIPGARAVGMGIMKAGQMLSLGGMFGDNIAQTLDTATNRQSFEEDKQEYKEIVKESIIDTALYLSGKKAGDFGNAMGVKALEKFGSKAIAKVAEIGTDATLSLTSDALITGEVDLKGEGFSQALGILTGLAGSKIQNMKTDVPDVKVETPKGETNDIDTKISNAEMLSVKNLNNDNQIIKYDSNNKNIKIETFDVSADKNVLPDNEFSQDKLNELYRSFGLPFGKENFNANNDYKNQYIKTDITFDNVVSAKTLYEYDELGNLIKKLQIKGSSIFGENVKFSQGETGDCALLSMVVGFLKNSQTRQQLSDAIVDANEKYEVKIGSQVVEVAKNELSNEDLSNLKSIRILELAYQKVGGSLNGEFAENVARIFGLNPIHVTSDEITEELLEAISKDSNNFVLSLGARIDADGIVNPNGEYLHYFSIKEINPETKKMTLIDTYDTSQVFEMSFDDIKIQGVSIDGGSIKETDLPNIERSTNETGLMGRNNGVKLPREIDKQHIIAKNNSGAWEYDINSQGELTGVHTDEAIAYLFSLSCGARVPSRSGGDGTIVYRSPSGDKIRIRRGSTITEIKKSVVDGKIKYERGYCSNGVSSSPAHYTQMGHSPEQALKEISDNLKGIQYIETGEGKYFVTKDTNNAMHYWEFKGDKKKIATLYEVIGLKKGTRDRCANIDNYTPFVHTIAW